MSSRIGWLASAGIIVLAMLLVGRGLRTNPAERGVEFAPDMVRTPAIKSYSQSPVLPHGSSMQPLVAGVVIRGADISDYGDGCDEAMRAGADLTNPFRNDDSSALARGERVFSITCSPCHGQDGETKPPAVLRGMIAPPSLLGARAVGLRDGEIFHIITRGQGKMSGYAAHVVPEDRWRVVLHLRRLQQGGAASR
jgi:mono/diheme cytochrome c family protein